MIDGEPMTLAEIARIEGISHQAVSEIIERALKKVRKVLVARGMKFEDLI
jgi:DNA-directed RNA polymerase specialized sigma subunit